MKTSERVPPQGPSVQIVGTYTIDKLATSQALLDAFGSDEVIDEAARTRLKTIDMFKSVKLEIRADKTYTCDLTMFDSVRVGTGTWTLKSGELILNQIKENGQPRTKVTKTLFSETTIRMNVEVQRNPGGLKWTWVFSKA